MGLALSGTILFTACSESDDGPPEFLVEAEHVSSSSIPSFDQIAPYDEALTVCEYRVHHVLAGTKKQAPEEGATIRVAYWAVVAGKNQPPLNSSGAEQRREMKLTPMSAVPGLEKVYTRNDLDFDPDEFLYLDLSQSLSTPAAPEKVRFDYRGPISHRMRIYWLTRHQLRLAVIGNSHAGAAVDPELFFQPENESIPVALNLSIAGSELEAQALVAGNYLRDLPYLEWVVWGVSPRIFNKHHDYDRRGKMFQTSPGFQYDQINRDQLWPAPSEAAPVSAETLEDAAKHEIEPWGWSPATHRDLPVPITPAASEKILNACSDSHFRWNSDAWETFAASVAAMTARGKQVLLFTPPYHPLIREGKAADFDDTGKKDYRKLVERLHALADANGKVTFLDIHKNGDHDFLHQDFADPDHLHQSGARKLTEKLIEVVEQKK